MKTTLKQFEMKLKMETKMAMVLLGMMALTTSCEKSSDKEEKADDTLLSGELTENRTLQRGQTYYLSGGYHVKAGATLYIEPGVTVIAKDDNIVDYILVEQGAKIDAQGTANEPIVLTSEKKEHGAWGGVHICGYAPINVKGTVSKSEIGDAPYGGDRPDDNSGVLKYIRLEYAGYSFSEEKEANGFTFYGVGNGTVAEYLEAYKGSDDGFEWFGGTVNCKYLVSYDNTDDLFDWTEGWSGKGQFWIGVQKSAECDCLIECDNNSKDFAASPVANPILSNITLNGNNSDINKRGIRLRAGTFARIYNSIVTGKSNCVTTETTETENSLVNGQSSLKYLFLSTCISCKEGIYSAELFMAKENNNSLMDNISLTSDYVGTYNGAEDLSADSFFTNVNYSGAVKEGNDWTLGWTLMK